MINEISVKGFKSLFDESIQLGKLTVFAGLNNSGKSTAVQALRMALARQSSSGPYIDGLGGYVEISSQFSQLGAPIEIALGMDQGRSTYLNINSNGYSYTGDEAPPIAQFISADRYGPRVGLPVIRDDEAYLNVGSLGEFSAHYGSMLETSLVAEAMRHPLCPSNILKHQLGYWMSEVSPGVKLDFSVLRKYDSSQLEVNGLRPTNSGFGISYVLPVLLSLLTMAGKMGEDDSDQKVKLWFDMLSIRGGILLIENPEAHLHPKGQTLIGRLAALAAASGLQIVLETHSDHVVDGIRLAVKQEEVVSADAIQIRFFTKELDSPTRISDINVLSDGRLDRWPKGFFDQGSLNLRSLAMKG